MLLLSFILQLLIGGAEVSGNAEVSGGAEATGAPQEGYRAVIRHGEGFLAAGSGGRIDWISASGTVTRSEHFPGKTFNCLLTYDREALAAGDKGILVVCPAVGPARKIGSGTGKNINALALFRGMVIEGTDGGILVSGDLNGPFKKAGPGLKGNVVSVSATGSGCYGVTDEGEIIHSADAVHWDVFDFNGKYSAFYGSSRFTKVLATENRIAVTGIRSDGSPVLFISHLGSVWNEKPLDYTDDRGTPGLLTGTPNDLFYDDRGDQFFLACDDGKVISLPSCSQCNKLTVLSGEDLHAITGNGTTLLIAGENFFIKSMPFRPNP